MQFSSNALTLLICGVAAPAVVSGFTPTPPKTASATSVPTNTKKSPIQPLRYKDESSPAIVAEDGSSVVQKLYPPSKKSKVDLKLAPLTKSLLAGSDLMYAFAKLRKAVLENEKLEDGNENKTQLKKVALVLTQNHADLVRERHVLNRQLQDHKKSDSSSSETLQDHIEEKIEQVDMMLAHNQGSATTNGQMTATSRNELHRYLKYEVTGGMLREFLDANKAFVKKTLDGDVQQILAKFEHKDIGVREFDDQFNERQLVYGITVNRTDKRITVFFRGSVDGNRDWPTNFNAFRRTLDVPVELKEHDENNSEIKVHRGFHAYLNEKLYEKTGRRLQPFDRAVDMISPNPSRRTKFSDIENNLKAMLSKPEFQDYRVCVSGHSLGGGLSQLLAYQLASNGELRQFKNALPVAAVTFASPRVGNDGFRQAFERLEAKGLLRHIRVTNAGDLVPVSFPVPGYKQTGLNLHVKGNGEDMEVEYQRDDQSLASEIGYGIKNKSSGLMGLKDDFERHHTPEEHYENLIGSDFNLDLLSSYTVEELYDEYVRYN